MFIYMCVYGFGLNEEVSWGVSLCLLLFSQKEGRPGDQSALKAHSEPICHRQLALAARGSSVHMICETWALHLAAPI